MNSEIPILNLQIGQWLASRTNVQVFTTDKGHGLRCLNYFERILLREWHT